jgi:DNA replication protein DnaC
MEAAESSQHTPKCKFCGRELRKVPVWHNFHTYLECDCAASKAAAGQQELEAVRADEQRLQRAYHRAGIPERYISEDTEADLADLGGGLYLFGAYGTGKTYTASAYAKEAIDRGRTAKFVTASQVISTVFDRGTSSEDMYEAMVKAWLLIVDDVEKFGMNESALAVLWRVVNDRYNACRPLIVTSNYRRDQMAAKLAEVNKDFALSIASRLVEMCRTIEFTGGDKRVSA